MASQSSNEIAAVDIHSAREYKDMNESFLIKLLSQKFTCLKITAALLGFDTNPMQRSLFKLDRCSD